MNGRAGRPDRRGNQRDRRRRKQWLLSTFGDGTTAPCAHCGKPLTSRTCEADRIVPGGSYRHDNIIPACRFCNASRGNKPLGAWAGMAKPVDAGRTRRGHSPIDGDADQQ